MLSVQFITRVIYFYYMFTFNIYSMWYCNWLFWNIYLVHTVVVILWWKMCICYWQLHCFFQNIWLFIYAALCSWLYWKGNNKYSILLHLFCPTLCFSLSTCILLGFDWETTQWCCVVETLRQQYIIIVQQNKELSPENVMYVKAAFHDVILFHCISFPYLLFCLTPNVLLTPSFDIITQGI